jgi:hypothetical protein
VQVVVLLQAAYNIPTLLSRTLPRIGSVATRGGIGSGRVPEIVPCAITYFFI